MSKKKGIIGIPFLDALLLSPVALAIVAIIIAVLLIIGVVVLWTYKLLTGIIIGGVFTLMIWMLLQTKMISLEKYPWMGPILILTPIVGFIAGVVGERTGAFYITPLMEKAEPYIPPYMVTEPIQFVTANVEVMLLMIVLVCVAVAFAMRRE